MKTIVKFFTAGSLAFALSGCALTGDVMQSVYDEKAEGDCRTAYDPSENTGFSCSGRVDESRWEKIRQEDVLRKRDAEENTETEYLETYTP